MFVATIGSSRPSLAALRDEARGRRPDAEVEQLQVADGREHDRPRASVSLPSRALTYGRSAMKKRIDAPSDA